MCHEVGGEVFSFEYVDHCGKFLQCMLKVMAAEAVYRNLFAGPNLLIALV